MWLKHVYTNIGVSGQLGLWWGGGIHGPTFERKRDWWPRTKHGCGGLRLAFPCKEQIETSLRWKTYEWCCGGLLAFGAYFKASSSVTGLQWCVPRAYKPRTRPDPVTLMWLCKWAKPRSVPRLFLGTWILFGKRSSICKSQRALSYLELHVL